MGQKREIELTMAALGIDYADDRLSKCGFAVDDNISESCVLVLGLNPAGDAEDAKRDSGEIPYLYYFAEDKQLSKELRTYQYSLYYKVIYEMVLKVLGDENGIKWSWCNQDFGQLCAKIENKISGFKSTQDCTLLKSFWNPKRNASTTLYIGDMFYYYETNSKDVLNKFKEHTANEGKYYEDMLKFHIDVLRDHKKHIRFIYINNATVSHGMCGKNIKSYDVKYGIPVFFGSMLSGQRAMDTFSRERLINEIKANMLP